MYKKYSLLYIPESVYVYFVIENNKISGFYGWYDPRVKNLRLTGTKREMNILLEYILNYYEKNPECDAELIISNETFEIVERGVNDCIENSLC